MDLSRYLASTQLMDCSGHVTHTLTLLPDGMVEVVMGSVAVVVDPSTKSVVRPFGSHVPLQVYEHAEMLLREALG